MSLSTKPNKYFFSNIVVAIGIVLVWRGVWHLVDDYLFPHHPTFSSIISIVIGLVLLYFVDSDLSLLGGMEEESEQIFNNKSRDIWIIGMTMLLTVALVVVIYLMVQ